MKNFIMLIVMAIVALGIYGYILNAVTLFYLGPVTSESLVRLLGMIVPPLGAIIGLLPV